MYKELSMYVLGIKKTGRYHWLIDAKPMDLESIFFPEALFLRLKRGRFFLIKNFKGLLSEWTFVWKSDIFKAGRLPKTNCFLGSQLEVIKRHAFWRFLKFLPEEMKLVVQIIYNLRLSWYWIKKFAWFV